MELTSLFPPEVWFKVIDLLDLHDVKALSGASMNMSRWLAPTLFKSIRVSNESHDIERMTAFLKRYGDIVTKITFQSFLCANGEDTTEIMCLKPILQDLLMGKGVPNLKTLELSFHPVYDSDDLYDERGWIDDGSNHDPLDNLCLSHLPESTEQVLEAERRYQWRSDIHGAFEAASQNTNLRHLEIKHLIPLQCSVWKTGGWHTFLSHLTHLKIDFGGGDKSDHWHFNPLNGYYDFVMTLGSNFFKYLTKLKRLQLICEAENILGLEGSNHSPLPISARDLPCIEDLELEYWFIDPPLQELISRRKKTLRRIALIDCKAVNDDEEFNSATNGITWAEFFRSVRKSQPPNLREFVVRIGALELDGRNDLLQEERENHGYVGEELAHIDDVHKQPGENKRLILFPYGRLDDRHGDYTEYSGPMREDIDEGQDQMEYDALMELVTGNLDKNRPDAGALAEV